MKLPKLPDSAKSILTAFEKKGFVCYAVGGCVRDLIMNRPTHDWDFTTNATPEEIIRLFPKTSFYNNKFGTVGVSVSTNGKEEIYQITTFRSEGSYSDKRRPDHVAWGDSIKKDLARRDFTINAIALSKTELVDPFNGQEDIRKKLVRAVGDPKKRFAEDALRLIRAVRLATELEFMIEEKTSQAISDEAESIATVANERVRDELLRILASDYPADGILLLKNTGLLHYILPELEATFSIPQKSPKRHHKYDVGTHSVEALRNCPSKDPIVRFATLLHDIGKAKTYAVTEEGVVTFYNHEIVSTTMVRNIAIRLHFSKHDTGRLIRLVRWHGFSVDEKQTDKALRRFIKNVGKENLDDMLAVRTGDRLGGGAAETSWRLELYKKRLEEVQKIPFSVTDLAIDGNDVMQELAIKPGPKVGTVLQQLFEQVEEGKLENDREILLIEIKKFQN
jgi:putative nucleotidyltransferase with HDIG domain